MINRRELIIGGACLATAATAEVLRPNRRVSLLAEGQKLDNGIPRAFGQWEMRDSDGVLAPQSEDSLAAKLYNQTVTRMYAGPDESLIMLLIAYGNTQSDTLQLHRPEVCYPAFGFEVTESRPTALPLAGGVAIPGRDLVAVSPGREERISYWTRVGEYLPVDNGEQRRMRFRTALAGIIPDGVLVRISNMQADAKAGFAMNARFAADLIRAVPPAYRPALVTTEKARQLASAA
ncbi:exosortase-associated protein EpsI, V-type [Sphingomonas sp.]|jgi:EpsI family protein|uniref:exosortase-associated protein EpsI, V-type n=1 Tax=Sphingomonas sp. TaxID=28214 RepID=UPI002DF1CBBF|nr:exosortase-associated protein EpsI, V-type [Sphingomonas sp.]HEV2569885.1 EpsI family protein [Sphingomonas sp.]